MFGDRVIDRGNYFFIPKFLKFQNKKGLNSNKPAIVSIREELIQHNLIQTVQQSLGNDFLIIKGIGKGIGKGEGTDKGSEGQPPLLVEPKIETPEFKYDFKPDTTAGAPGLTVSPSECLAVVNSHCEYFAVSTDVMNPKYTAVTSFVEMLIHRGEFEKLKTAFEKYTAYKARSQESIHGIEKWMGDIEKFFKDGEWTATDWEKKLNNLEKNGKHSNKSNPGITPAASAQTATGKGFGTLRRNTANGTGN